MIILKNGNQSSPPENWWVDFEMTCPSCKAVFKLELCDLPVLKLDPRQNAFRPAIVTAECPCCKAPVSRTEMIKS